MQQPTEKPLNVHYHSYNNMLSSSFNTHKTMLSKVQNMFLFRVLTRPLVEQSVNDSALPERRLSVTDLSSENNLF